MNGINVLSLFDGISCGQVALNKAGIKINKYYASEIEKNSIIITQKNYPNTIQLGNIINITYKNGKLHTDNGDFNVDKIDLIIGGSPCQSFTFAGKREGMVTEENINILNLSDYIKLKKDGYSFAGQSYLFWEYMRLLNEIKPRYFLLENVKMINYWRDIITNAIGVKPININSSLLSAQRRDRLYWTNINNGLIEQPADKQIYLKDIIEESLDNTYPLTQKHLDGFMRSYPNWKPCLLNEKSRPLLASYYKQPPHCPYIPSKSSESGYRRLSPLECERLQTLPDNYTEYKNGKISVSDSSRLKSIGNGWTVEVIVHIMSYLPKEWSDC